MIKETDIPKWCGKFYKRKRFNNKLLWVAEDGTKAWGYLSGRPDRIYSTGQKIFGLSNQHSL